MEVECMASTIRVRVEDELKIKSINPYEPMTEKEMLEKLKNSREQGKYRDADDVISDMRAK
jgi:DNA-damage-inducible protein J